jgi:hypothetical protein
MSFNFEEGEKDTVLNIESASDDDEQGESETSSHHEAYFTDLEPLEEKGPSMRNIQKFKPAFGSSADDPDRITTILRRGGLAQKRDAKLDQKIAVKTEALVKRGPLVKRESVPVGSILAPEPQSDASGILALVANGSLSKDFVVLPEISSQENPIRLLKIDSQVFDIFCELKQELEWKFAHDNPGIKKKEYDICMECWLYRLYPEDPAMVDNMRQFLCVSGADNLLFATLRGHQRFADCVSCHRANPLGAGDNWKWMKGRL